MGQDWVAIFSLSLYLISIFISFSRNSAGLKVAIPLYCWPMLAFCLVHMDWLCFKPQIQQQRSKC